MAVELQWIDPADGLEHDGLTFSAIVPGVPSAAESVELWNDKGGTLGADTAREIRIVPLARPEGAATPFKEAGYDIVDKLGLQMRITGGLNGGNYSATSYQSIGLNTWLEVPGEMAADTGVAMDVRPYLPPTADDTAMEVRLRVDSRLSVPIQAGAWEAGGSGVLHGLGDVTRSEMLHLGAELTFNGDDTIDIPDVVWISLGAPYARLLSTETFDDTDGSAATLGVNEEYQAAVTLSSAGATITKGDKAAIGASVRPTLPAGALLWFWVTRDDAGVIEAADVEEVAPLGGYGLRGTSGLTATIGAGRALAGRYLPRADVEAGYDVVDDDTSTVWLLPDGSISVSATAPESQALALLEATAAASAITSTTDLRRWAGGRMHTPTLRIDSPAAADVDVWTNSTGRPLDILPGGLTFDLYEDWSTLSAVSGSWKLELEQRAPGGSWVSLFTSSGTDDRRPDIQFDGTTQAILPEVRTVAAGNQVRIRVVSIATGGTAASGLALGLALWESR